MLENEQPVSQFLSSLANKLSCALKERQIAREYFSTTNHNRKRVASDSIGNIIHSTGNALGYEVMPEQRFYFNDGGYCRPDFLMYKGVNLELLIEYQSTNGSDSRLITNNLYYYSRALEIDLNETGVILPKYWLVIYTLTDAPVEQAAWSSWDYNKSDREYQLMARSPHRFYKRVFENPQTILETKRGENWEYIPKYHNVNQLCESNDWQCMKLFFINLTTTGLEIDYPKTNNGMVKIG